MNTPEYTCSLLCLADNQNIQVTQAITVGRGDKCDLIIKLGQASRKHAQLEPSEEGLWVEDLQSSNGTYINETVTVGKVLAKHGDILKFDTASYKVVFTKAGEQPAPDAETEEDDDTTVIGAKPAAEPKRASTLPPSWALERNQAVDGTQILGASATANLKGERARNAEKVDVPTVLGVSDPIKDVRFTLIVEPTVNEWSIGRSEAAHVSIEHQSVSTNHAQIINDGSRWKLVDLVSANGTFVNDSKGLTTYLRHGDLIRFGQIECQILLPDTAPVRANTVIIKNKKAGNNTKKMIMGAIVVMAVLVAAVVLTR